MQREEDEKERKDLKHKIIQQATLVEYDDDFDEEKLLQNNQGRSRSAVPRSQTKVEVQPARDIALNSTQDFDKLSEIPDPSKLRGVQEEEDDDDLVDEMARFVEGADQDLVMDRSNSLYDDEKIKKQESSSQASLKA
mmetsp:Transcript_10451/g.17539  ORF Transcript_10451/g.17539 Transcript_10451/m.17539 type:complete len:137 (-) Transcript_10451:603-1013(-)